jgi:hypothetical protein
MDFNLRVRVKFNSQKRARMGIWKAMEMLNQLVDESDPDVSVLVMSILLKYIDKYVYFPRRLYHKLNICYKPPRQFVEMVNRTGCRCA